jgi:heme/copper-type cytochrome/quinol oxidase subunit 1
MSSAEAPVLGVAGTPSVPGLAIWLTSTDHRHIGRLTIGVSTLWLAFVAVLGVLVGLERVADSSMLFGNLAAPQMVILARVLGVFGVLIPVLMGVAIATVPGQVGASTIAMPRLASLGMYLWLLGVVTLIVAVFNNGVPGGDAAMLNLHLLALGTIIVGLVAGWLAVFTTVATSRRAGLTLANAPLLSWSGLVGAFAALITLPVLLGTVIYVGVDHRYGQLAFGGSKDVMTWLGWGSTQPQTFIYAIVAFGLLAQLAPSVAQRSQPLRGALLVGIGLIAATAVGTVSQTTHSFVWEGSLTDKVKSFVPYALYNGLPLLGALIILGLSLLALKGCTVKSLVPFVPVLLGAGMVFTGMLGNAVQQIDAAGLAGTSFEEGAGIYMVYGAALCAWGAVAYFGPSWTARTMKSSAILGVSGLGFLGTVLAGLPLYLAGFAGQQVGAVGRFDYSGPKQVFNALSMLGHGAMASAVIVGAAVALKSFSTGSQTGTNPWGVEGQ